MRETELLTELDRNPWDGETSVRYGNGLRSIERLNSRGLVSEIEVEGISKETYEYNSRNKVASIRNVISDKNIEYDVLGRLATTQSGQKSVHYYYDNVGNRLIDNNSVQSKSPNRKKTTFGESHGNRLHPSISAPVLYNSEGSIVSMPGKYGSYELKYNVEQRPVQLLINGEMVATYGYNGFGQRVRKTVYKEGSSETYYYLYEGTKLVAESDEQGDVVTQYLYLDQKPAILFKRGELHFIHNDHRGAPTSITNESAGVVWQADYTPYGMTDLVAESLTFNLRLLGQYYDAESGFHHNYFRDYDPATGRYLTSDPIGLHGGLNTYAYAQNDPLNRTDPLGLYDSAVHYYMTYFLAITAGLDEERALIMASATQYVDDSSRTAPIQLPLIEMFEALNSYHFTLDYNNGNGGDSSPRRPNESDEEYIQRRFENPQSQQLDNLREAAMLYSRVCRFPGGPSSAETQAQLYGEYLHAFEDSFAHRNQENLPYTIFNSEGGIGHAAAGHSPDHTYNQVTITDPHHTQPGADPTWSDAWSYNELRTLQMEQEVFESIQRDFGVTSGFNWEDLAADGDANIGVNRGSCSSCWTNGIAPEYDQANGVTGVLQEFNSFQDEGTDAGILNKKAILDRFLVQNGMAPIPEYSEDLGEENRERILEGVPPLEGVMLP